MKADYFNRELSWLQFNHRVLEEAQTPRNPLLERLKFLAITSSNLDEFFMVRVGGLKMALDEGSTQRDAAGMAPDEQLRAINVQTRSMVAEQYGCYLRQLEPALTEQGIRRVHPESVTPEQRNRLRQHFENEIRAVLAPLTVTSPAQFPLLINQTLNVCVRLAERGNEAVSHFAVIPFGHYSERFVPLDRGDDYQFILLEDVVRMFCAEFFAGQEVRECVPFRITRNADMRAREDLAADFLAEMENILIARKLSACVRLEISSDASGELLQFLQTALDVASADVFSIPGPLDLAAFMRQAFLPGFDHLRDESWPPQRTVELGEDESMFDLLARRDVLIYQPFDSFEPVVRWLEEAAEDPQVLSIKQVLYRTSKQSPIVAALARAARNGKTVTALVELKARFDEARNIEWAKHLEQAGVEVIYGVKRLKTHAKVCLISRSEAGRIRRYTHYGTGNYNESTAKLYTDVSYMTSNEILGADAASFFHTVTGYSQPQAFRKIEAAPIGLRERILELIDQEIEFKRQGHEAFIQAKLNSLVDTKIIDALYRASQAGVTVRLNIRGICCLRPGIPGVSENITVISIIDRYLEHARIAHFHHGGSDQVFISSADWMPRNLIRRVELLVAIEDAESRRRLISILQSCFRDNVQGRLILSDGGYERLTPPDGVSAYRSQEALFQDAVRRAKQIAKRPEAVT